MIWNRIVLFCPTYGRSHNHLPAFIQSAMDTASEAKNICFSFLVNCNDKVTKDYLLNFHFNDVEWEMIEETLPKPHLAKYYNQLYGQTKFNNPETVVTMVGDDMIFRTKDWDRKLIDIINYYKGIGVFWCNDDYIAREKLCVNLFVTRMFIEMTESNFMCELFPAEMIDVVWTEVGRLTRTSHFLPDVHLFHNHGGKNPDCTYNRLQPLRREGHRIGKDKARLEGARIANLLLRKGIQGTSIC